MFRITDPFVSKFQLSSWWFKVNLKKLEVVLHYHQYHQQENSPRAWCYHHLDWQLAACSYPLLLQTFLFSLWSNSSIFVLSDHKTFLHKAFGLSMWVQFSCAWILEPGLFFSVHGDASLWTLSLVFQQLPVHGRIFDSLGLLPDRSEAGTYLNNFYLCTIVWSLMILEFPVV